jgi:hypothetical protein
MNLRRFSLTSLLGIFIFLTSCSVYKSSGRKSFESKAPDNIRTSSLNAALKTETAEQDRSDTCWSQPANEPLWHIDSNFPLSVSPLNNEEIQVCIQDL